MEESSEGESSYESSQDSYIGETDKEWSSGEDGCNGSCSDHDYSGSECGDDPLESCPEPEPPDHSQNGTRWYKGGIGRKNESWSHATDSEISMDEDDERDIYLPKRAEKTVVYGRVPYRVQAQPKSTSTQRAQQAPTGQKKKVSKISSYTSDTLVFSGSSKNPEVYLRWEMNMEKWLRSNNIPKEKKLSQAVQAFTGNAYKWWLKESGPNIYNHPVVDWRDLKDRMYKEFAKKYQGQVDTTSKSHYQTTPRKVMPTLKPHTAPKAKKAHDLKPKKMASSVLTSNKGAKRSFQAEKFQERPTTTPLHELQKLQDMFQKLNETLTPKEEHTSNQGKSSDPMKPKNPTCYKCHKRGHFAAVCPSKKLKETSLEERTEISPICDSFDHSDLLVSNSCIMHLSMSKGVDTDPKENDPIKEEPPDKTPEMDQKQGQEDVKSLSFQSNLGKVSSPSVQTSLSLVSTEVMHLSLPNGYEPGTRLEGHTKQSQKMQEGQPIQQTCPMKKIILQLAEPIWVNLSLNFPIYKFSNPDIIHLFPAKGDEIISEAELKDPIDDPQKENTWCVDAKGEQEVTINKFLNHDAPPDHKTKSRRPDQNRGVVLSFLLKGEPPDLPPKIKPTKHQGKTLESQKRMKPNLLYLGAGYPVSRSKPFQGRGDVTVMKSIDQPEADQLLQSPNQRIKQDMCSIKTSYFTNQKEICYETNFPGFYTQGRFYRNWSHAKSNPEQEDMDFTIQRFSSPSICEYPHFEEYSSPTMKRPSRIQASDIKMDLLSFQQAKNEEKSPRKYGVVVQSPNPAKPPYLPYMEDPVLKSNQNQFWQPGDFVRLLETLHEISRCTNIHWIRRILEEIIEPTRSQLWKDFAIFRFTQIQTKTLRPGEFLHQPRPPEDLSNNPGRDSIIIPWAIKHRIRRIYLWPHLPYLESQAFKLQQLYSLQLMDVISTLKAIRKIPRMLTYPLKPSRFKETQANTNSQRYLQRLYFDHDQHHWSLLFIFVSFLCI